MKIRTTFQAEEKKIDTINADDLFQNHNSNTKECPSCMFFRNLMGYISQSRCRIVHLEAMILIPTRELAAQIRVKTFKFEISGGIWWHPNFKSSEIIGRMYHTCWYSREAD
eukprot:TRINITY_DN6307_c0_g1_i1.p1 TRINITY_DN6307_c0_g1~~TRINITY_DN6307_c0_g1_i1.p1  ORF type:complete len:111 (+),score=15.17 TRINITY_DN6307_c0_g1_i1:178-510(+)